MTNDANIHNCRQYYYANRDALLKQKRDRYHSNPRVREDQKRRALRYHHKHKKEIHARAAIYRQKNKEQLGKAVRERRELIWALKDQPCMDCGIKYPPWAMDFDHVRGPKLFRIGGGPRIDINRLLAEVEKCDVVCANCHRIRTYQRVQDRIKLK